MLSAQSKSKVLSAECVGVQRNRVDLWEGAEPQAEVPKIGWGLPEKGRGLRPEC